MLAVDPGHVVAGVVVVHHGVPHVRDRLPVALVLDVIDERERDVLDVDEGEENETVKQLV
jgi:hypothetical protein